MLNSMSSGKRWVLVAFAASICTLFTTFFLQGDVRTFAYILISMAVGLYAVLSSGKTKRG